MVARGDVWWVDFGDPFGSEPGLRRPAAIVSSDRFNRSRIATVLVAAVTSNIGLKEAPGNVLLDEGDAGLPKPSVVNVSQLLIIDRRRLVERSGTLAPVTVRSLDAGLRLVLAL